MKRPLILAVDDAPDWDRVIALTQHEHGDGSGYPKELKGEAIPWPGRLVAIVDAFEAITTTPFYREPLSIELAAPKK